MTIRYASWGIIVDDVVFPDGRTAMGQLGGGGLYASVGMRVWSEDVGIIASVGQDFDGSQLDAMGIEAIIVRSASLPTPRAWQLFEEDGKRTQIPRVDRQAWHTQLTFTPSRHSIPETLEAAHFLGRGDENEEEMVTALHAAGIVLSAEPIVDRSNTERERQRLLRCLPYFTLFSPDIEALDFLVGAQRLESQVRTLAAYGPRIVAVRQGAEGSLIYDRVMDQFRKVPAAEAQVVDVTGAGNAYCGGLLVGYIETHDLNWASAMAAVSAAMVIEQVGPPVVSPNTRATAQRRAEKLLPLIGPYRESAS